MDGVAQGASFTLPGTQQVNLSINGSAAYQSWLEFSIYNLDPYIDDLNSSQAPFYFTSYNSTIEGYHDLYICARDSANLEGCYPMIQLYAAGTTPILLSTNVTEVNITGITLGSSDAFDFNFTAMPDWARALELNFTVGLPSGWSASPGFFNFSTVLKKNSVSGESHVTVISGTYPGNYTLNVTANWTELNGFTNGTNSTSIIVMVQPNPSITILEDSLNYNVRGGNSQNQTMSVFSNG